MSMEATLATWELTKVEVNSREKFLLLSLARRAGEEHTCWPSIKRMVEDTGFDRKTIVDARQSLIDKKLIIYTGRMVGRSNQIPEMKLVYVDKWEKNRNSPRLKDHLEPVDKSVLTNPTGTENGTGTSPKNGTGTGTENGTLNSKEEYINRNNKSSYVLRKEKTVDNVGKRPPSPPSYPAKQPKPQSTFSDPTKQSTSYKYDMKDFKTNPQAMEAAMMKLPRSIRPKRFRESEKSVHNAST